MAFGKVDLPICAFGIYRSDDLTNVEFPAALPAAFGNDDLTI